MAMNRFLSPGTTNNIHKRLTHAHLIDTATILAPEWRHLSPCAGVALQRSPLKSNMWRLGQQQQQQQNQFKTNKIAAGTLAKALYFQSHPGAPIRPTRIKSVAAAHF
jgi:hypothetical protein